MNFHAFADVKNKNLLSKLFSDKRPSSWRTELFLTISHYGFMLVGGVWVFRSIYWLHPLFQLPLHNSMMNATDGISTVRVCPFAALLAVSCHCVSLGKQNGEQTGRCVDGGSQVASWTHCIFDLVSGSVDLTSVSNLHLRQCRLVMWKSSLKGDVPFLI